MKYSTVKSALAIAAIAFTSLPLGAQAKKAAGGARCTMPDTTMQWFKDQRAWLDDSSTHRREPSLPSTRTAPPFPVTRYAV